MLKRTFTDEDQIAFARLSGDNNELHLNAVAARRSLFGSPVVHGVNTLLWALDSCLQSRVGHYEITRLKALFTRQIKVGEEIRVLPVKADDAILKLKILAGETAVATIKAELSNQTARDSAAPVDGLPEQVEPVELSLHEMDSLQGELQLFVDTKLLKQLYPSLSSCLSPLNLAVILGSTRIVGVYCPGKYSLFSELELVAAPNSQSAALSYTVDSIDARFGLVEIKLSAPGMTGVVRAFRRPSPQQQASYAALCNLVAANEFSGQRALVVGGSRGLGEVAAKLLAAGGADVKITYHRGAAEAGQVVDEIAAGGGNAGKLQFDVLNPAPGETTSSLNGWHPTHLYYFATPFIQTGTIGQYSVPLFRHFCDYYVSGLSNTLAMLSIDRPLSIFYPSSVMVEAVPDNLQEYVTAKIAGEMNAAALGRTCTAMYVYAPRLPKVATDQTANVAAVQNDDPVPIMLAELRAFNARVT